MALTPVSSSIAAAIFFGGAFSVYTFTKAKTVTTGAGEWLVLLLRISTFPFVVFATIYPIFHFLSNPDGWHNTLSSELTSGLLLARISSLMIGVTCIKTALACLDFDGKEPSTEELESYSEVSNVKRLTISRATRNRQAHLYLIYFQSSVLLWGITVYWVDVTYSIPTLRTTLMSTLLFFIMGGWPAIRSYSMVLKGHIGRSEKVKIWMFNVCVSGLGFAMLYDIGLLAALLAVAYALLLLILLLHLYFGINMLGLTYIGSLNWKHGGARNG